MKGWRCGKRGKRKTRTRGVEGPQTRRGTCAEDTPVAVAYMSRGGGAGWGRLLGPGGLLGWRGGVNSKLAVKAEILKERDWLRGGGGLAALLNGSPTTTSALTTT